MQIPDAIIEKAARAAYNATVAARRDEGKPWFEYWDEADADEEEQDEYRREAAAAVEAVMSDIVAARDQQHFEALEAIYAEYDALLDDSITGTAVCHAINVVNRAIRALPGLFGEQGEESD